MKKLFLFSLVLMFGAQVFAQKKEVKAAEKALKSNDLKTALDKVNQACKLKDNADPKTMARIYFTKAKIYNKMAEKDENNYKNAVKFYQKTLEFEKKNKLSKYSPEVKADLQSIEKKLFSIVKEANDEKDYAKATGFMALIYAIDPSDDNLYTLSLLQLYSGKFQEAYDNLKKLYDKGYTGVKTLYKLTNKETGEEVVVPDEKTLKLFSKDPHYINPKKEQTKNRRPEIVTNMLYALNQMGKEKEAFELIQKAKEENPDNLDLILGEANFYLKKKDNKNFTKAMLKAFELQPDNPNFAYNVAIGYLNDKQYDKAREFFKKTLELDPNNKNAVYGLALIELAPEEAIVEELNQNLNNDRKYKELKAEQRKIYSKALPYLERYYQMDPENYDVAVTLKNIYLELDMNDKYKIMKAKIKELKSKQGK
jgi:tetratricopeptide (TPR) repeat protein